MYCLRCSPTPAISTSYSFLSLAGTNRSGRVRAQPARAQQQRSTERSTTGRSLLAPRPIRRPGGLRLEVGQTRSCIPRSDAPGRTSGSRRIHVPHDRRPTAPTSSTPSHAARRASRARRAGCRIGLSAARHTATLAAWSPAVNRAMRIDTNDRQKFANTRRNIVT